MANNSEHIVKKLSKTDNLLDVMLQVEDYLDSLDLYVFANWIDGTLVDGPYVERYWVKFTLKYPYKDMPDPQGGLRLLKYGSKVTFEKATEKKAIEFTGPEDLDPQTRKPKLKKEKIWLVNIRIPRRFIEELNIEGLDLYDEESSDIEDLLTAQGENIDATTGIQEEPVADTGGEGLEI